MSVRPNKDLRTVTSDDLIAWFHAQVEVSLEDLGVPHASLRSGAFAYNIIWQQMRLNEEGWKAMLSTADWKADCVCQRDIGRVGGALLTRGPIQKGKEAIYLFGPQLLSHKEQVETIARLTGKHIDMDVREPEAWGRLMSDTYGLPKPIVEYMVSSDLGDEIDDIYGHGRFEEGVKNIKRYSGYEPTSFEDFVNQWFVDYMSKTSAPN